MKWPITFFVFELSSLFYSVLVHTFFNLNDISHCIIKFIKYSGVKLSTFDESLLFTIKPSRLF